MRIYSKFPVSDQDLDIKSEDIPLEFRHSFEVLLRYLEGYRHGKMGITTRYHSKEEMSARKIDWLSYCSGYMIGQKKYEDNSNN